MIATVVTQITINSSASEVFKYLTDLRYNHLWNPQIKKLSSRKKLKLHSTYETVSKVLGVTVESKNTVTVFKPDAELQLENATGTVQYKANFKLTANGSGGIVLKCTTKVSSDSKAFAFTKPVMTLLARRELQTDLAALKIAVENQLE